MVICLTHGDSGRGKGGVGRELNAEGGGGGEGEGLMERGDGPRFYIHKLACRTLRMSTRVTGSLC